MGAGAGGSLSITSSTGTKIFPGLVTIASGATWNNSGDSPLTFRGGITNAGTFTAGNGIYTFDTNFQSLTGVFSIPNMTINGISLSNKNSLTVGSALNGTGIISQAINSSLTLSGTSFITSINAINAGNTVTYNGTSQNIKSAEYQNLTINQAGGTDATLGGNATVNDALTLTAGKLNTGVNVLTMATSASSIVGSGSSRFIVGNLEWFLPAR